MAPFKRIISHARLTTHLGYYASSWESNLVERRILTKQVHNLGLSLDDSNLDHELALDKVHHPT